MAAASGGWDGLWRPEHADVHHGSQSRGGPVQLKQDLAAALRWGGGSLRVGRQSPILNCHEHHPTENSRHRRQVATFRDRSRIPRTTQPARILGREEVGCGVTSGPALRSSDVRAGGFEEDAAAGLKTASGKQQGLCPLLLPGSDLVHRQVNLNPVAFFRSADELGQTPTDRDQGGFGEHLLHPSLFHFD